MPETTKNKSNTREWIESLVIALILAMVIRTFAVEIYKIPTGSMIPALLPNDRILVNKFVYGARVPFIGARMPGLRQPKRGDVVVFIYPEDRSKNFIKRLIGLPGETIEIRAGNIYINGSQNKERLLYNRYYYNRTDSDFGKENQIIKIPNDAYYVLGDNSVSSRDSRYWGFVPKNNVLGKAICILWPLNRIRVIE